MNNGVRDPIEVAIIDKNPLIVRGLKSLLQDDGRFEPVVCAPDGERFLDVLGRVPVEIIISGWIMPYCSGLELLKKLRDIEDAPRTIIYTGQPVPRAARDAMKFGAAGFCAKSDPPEKLLDVLDAVARGNMIFPFIDVATLDDDPLGDLTPREGQMLAMLAGGQTNSEIARDLGVSTNTVKFHLRNLYGKLNVRNRAEAAALHVTASTAQSA